MGFRPLSVFSICLRAYRLDQLATQLHCERIALCPRILIQSNWFKFSDAHLGHFCLSPSTELDFVKPKCYSLILEAEIKFSENHALCLEFLRERVRYGKGVVMACTAFVTYSSCSQSRNSQDLVDDAARLETERKVVLDEMAVQPRGASFHIAGHSR